MPTNTSPALPANPDQVLASLLIQNQTQTSLMQQHLESFLAAMTALQTKLTQLPFQTTPLPQSAFDFASALLSVDSLANLGYSGHQFLTGTGGNDQLTAGAGSDVLDGGAGDDVLDGGGSDDVMRGGAGNDTYYVSTFADSVVERSGEGIDAVYAADSFTLPVNVENLALIGERAINGTGNALDNTLIGNAAANFLAGMAGDDVIDGGAGADRMSGGLGNDTFIVDNAGDTVIERANEGTDTVYASVSYTLTKNVENLVLTGHADLWGWGNALANAITGNDADNFLFGDAGADTLIGGAGNDRLDGGIGRDVMSGGTGDDVYIVDASADQVVEADGEGDDTVYASVNFTLSANVENLVLTGSAVNGMGNDGDNSITGTTGNNVLNGGAGNDRLDGDAGNDKVIGGLGDDTLTGGAGNDTLTGSAGDDTFVFRSGFGHDVVTDFRLGTAAHHDTLDLRGLGFTSLGDIIAHTDQGADAVIHAGSDTIVLTGVSSALFSAHAEAFLF